MKERMAERERLVNLETEELSSGVPAGCVTLDKSLPLSGLPFLQPVQLGRQIRLSLSSLPALTFYAFSFHSTWAWLFQENVKRFKGQTSKFARHLLSLFGWSCLRSRPGDFLWYIHFLISPAIFPCLHWLIVAETGHGFSKQIFSSMPTGISCLQEPLFTRYQLFEDICVLPHQNNLISNYLFSSNIIFFNVIIIVV